jgi:hypothetical protein
MVGNGVNGSGAWLRLSGWHRWLAGFMLRQAGFPKETLRGDLEGIYEQKVLEWVRESSLDAVVLLAHERVHDPDGSPRPDLGSMFVPNDVVLDMARRHPEFLAGVSIHPARPDAIDELDRCVELGAVLMKCLPNCQNIDFSDNRYKSFWVSIGLRRYRHRSALCDPQRRVRQRLFCGLGCDAKGISKPLRRHQRDGIAQSMWPFSRLPGPGNFAADHSWKRFSCPSPRSPVMAAKDNRSAQLSPDSEHRKSVGA